MPPLMRGGMTELPERGKILIIESSSSLRNALTEFLTEHYLVQGTDSIASGREEVGRFQPDLILLAKELVDESGIETLSSLKSVSHSGSAIVLLSGHTTIDEAVAAIKGGAADLVSKPIEPVRLQQIIEQNLKQIQRRKTLLDLPQFPDSTAKEQGSWSFSGNLENVFMPDLLQFPSFSQLTGTLEVQSGLVNTSIFFLNGEILSAGSSDPRMYLGQFLLRNGILDENRLLELIVKQEQERVFLGKLIIQEGISDEATISEILIKKITETVTNLFLQKTGVYNFYQNLVPPYIFHMVNVPLIGLIMEGEVKAEMWHKIRKVVPHLRMIVQAVASWDQLYIGDSAASAETVRWMLTGSHTVEDILYETHTSEWELLSYLYPFYEKGLIRFDPAPDASEHSLEKAVLEQSLERVRRMLVSGDYEKAVRLLYRLVKEPDCDLHLTLPLLEDAEQRYKSWFYSHVLRAQDIPLLRSRPKWKAAHQAMEVFLLNRINGIRNVKALVNLAPAREVEVLAALQHLLESGFIEILNAAGSSGEIPNQRELVISTPVSPRIVERILSELPVGVITLDSQGQIRFANKYFLKIANLNQKDLLNQDISLIFPDLKLDAIRDSYEREFVWEGPGSSSAIKRYWLYSTHTFSHGSNDMTILVRDVTESHRRDLENFRKDRLTSLGEFVAGMIHQLKNPVMLLETGVKLLSMDDLDRKDLRDIGQRMEKNVERIRNLISDTLNYVSMDESAFTWLNLNELIEKTLPMFRESPQNEEVKFHFQPLPEPPLIRGNVVQIREVLINLINNALQAMKFKGQLQITTDLQEELEGGISRKYLLMVVSDTGGGMSSIVMEKIFTPFFTTKAAGKGLGLSFAKRILEEQGGFMRCWSKEGIGTHFYVYFKIGEKDAFYLDRR